MVRISKMSGKLKGIGAINTDTTSNKFCKQMQSVKSNICNKCYSQRMLTTFRSNCVKSFKSNSEALSTRLLETDELPVITDKLFRFSAHGEVINETMYKNLIAIAKHNPGTTFAFWTKRKDYVKKYGKLGARNVILIYSEPKLNNKSKVPENFDKIFKVHNTLDARKGKVNINCVGDCMDCKICYTKNRIKNVNEIVKEKKSSWNK